VWLALHHLLCRDEVLCRGNASMEVKSCTISSSGKGGAKNALQATTDDVPKQ